MTAYCGIDCERCRVFRATVDGDGEQRSLAAQYYAEMGIPVSESELRCRGCRSEERMAGCGGCPYRKCGIEKGVRSCGECGEYPCDSLRWYTKNYIEPSLGKLIMVDSEG
jgi:hypothetical protein